MFKSLWTRFLILLFSVSVISLSASLILRELVLEDFKEYKEGEIEDRIFGITASLEGSYEKYSGWNEDALRDNTVWALMLGYEVRITGKDGKELINTEKAIKNLSPLMKRRLLSISGISLERDSIVKEFTDYPLFLGGAEIGHLETRFIGKKGDPVKEAIFLKRSNRFLLLSLFLLGGLSLILSLIFSRRLTNPLKRLTSAARDISEGNIKSRVSISGVNEIGELAKTFNRMAGNIEIQETLRRKLTSNIAHELRTPLTAIKVELEGMMDGVIPFDRERLFSLLEETGRLKKIIEGIEELSRAEASVIELRREHIDLGQFIENLKNRFEKIFSDKGVRLEFEGEKKLSIYADPDKLSQIIINLLSNALKSTDNGGNVRIRTGEKGDYIFVEVADTGSGIKEEDLPFIFERFYKASEGGLGLGLTIARELAEAHGGRIEVKSEYRKGSTFTLYIPSFTKSS